MLGTHQIFRYKKSSLLTLINIRQQASIILSILSLKQEEYIVYLTYRSLPKYDSDRKDVAYKCVLLQ